MVYDALLPIADLSSAGGYSDETLDFTYVHCRGQQSLTDAVIYDSLAVDTDRPLYDPRRDGPDRPTDERCDH